MIGSIYIMESSLLYFRIIRISISVCISFPFLKKNNKTRSKISKYHTKWILIYNIPLAVIRNVIQ